MEARYRISRRSRGAVATFFAGCLLYASPAYADLQHGVWEGAAVCQTGPRFYRASIEPAERGARLVVDVLDSAGGRAWARSVGSVSDTRKEDANGSVHNAAPGSWAVRPFAEPPLPKVYLLSSDHATLAATGPFGDCSSMSLGRLDVRVVTGRVAGARGLAPRYVGTFSCSPTQPRSVVELDISSTSDAELEGTVTYRSHPMGGQGGEGSYTVIGEFGGDSGTLTLIGDRWLGPTPRAGDMPDMVIELRDGGARLIGLTGSSGCRTVELFVPGFEPAAGIALPVPPRPIAEWNDAAACVSLVGWASQALAEAGVSNFYRGITSGRVREVGIGLFVDDRFVPFFGKPFEELSAAEKRRVAEISAYCVRLTEFNSAMRLSGAAQFVTDFFRGLRPELETVAPRVRLLKARLSREMDGLRQQPVTEKDIPDLNRRLLELDERFSDLWNEDLTAARALMQDKLDLARGDMERRILAEIEALPSTRAAFVTGGAIESSIAHIADDPQRVARLRNALGARLAAVADTLLGMVAAEHEAASHDLDRVHRLSTAVDALWPAVNRHARGDGPGLQTLRRVAAQASKSAFDQFVQRTNGMMNAAQGFAARELAYRHVASFYARHVPDSSALSGAFAQYTKHIDSLKPVPRREDLVDSDGTPSSLGLKVAIAEFASQVWGQMGGLVGINLSRLYEGIRVAAVRKLECTPAQSASHWCTFDMRWQGPFPFLWLLDLSSYRARFALQQDGWRIVETPPSASTAPSARGTQGKGFMDMSDPMQFWGANIMMGIK